MLDFLDVNSTFMQGILLICYFSFLLYIFNRGRKFRLKKKENKFIQKVSYALGTEELPLTKKGENINWSKVYSMLKKMPDSPEKGEVFQEVENRKIGKKK